MNASSKHILRIIAVLAGLLAGAGMALAPASAQGSTPCGPAPAGANVIVSNAPVIAGTAGIDFICAGSADNLILAYAGDDIVHGGGGDDELQGHSGDDELHGGPGNDLGHGGPGEDLLFGGGGNDELLGFTGHDVLDGGPGDDELRGGAGDDTHLGQGGNDLAIGAFGDDQLIGHGGDDVLRGQQNDDELLGGNGNDTLASGGGHDLGRGGAGDDQLGGGGGNDELSGEGGDDRLFGNVGDDLLRGGADVDHAGGGTGIDVCVTAETTSNCENTNKAPVAVDDTGATRAPAPVDIEVLDNDSDPDGDPLAVDSLDLSGTLGSATFESDGTVTYDPGTAFDALAPLATADDTFGYTVSDGEGGTDTATVTVTVTAANHPPVLGDQTLTTDENTADSIDIVSLASDPEGGAVTIVGVDSTGTTGEVTFFGGVVSYDPDKKFEELDTGDTDADSFEVTVADPEGATTTITVDVTITGVNDTPVAEDDPLTTDEDTPLLGDALDDNGEGEDFDIDGDELTVIELDGEAVPAIGTTDSVGVWGTLSIAADGSLLYTPALVAQTLAVGDEETDEFEYTISDGNSTATATISVEVTGVNDDPIAVNDEAEDNTTDEDTPLTVYPLANDSDIDGDPLSIKSFDASTAESDVAQDGPEALVVDPTGAYQSLDDGDQATDVITYTVTDPFGGTDTASIGVTITGVNDAPEADDDEAETDEDTSVGGDVLTNDDDVDELDELSVVAVDEVPLVGGTLDTTTDGGSALTMNEDGTFTYAPGPAFQSLAAGEEATDSFTYEVSDGDESDTASVTITITGENDTPMANDDEGEATDEDTPLTVFPLGNDSDPDTSDSLVIDPASIEIGDDLGTVTVAPDGLSFVYDPTVDLDHLDTGDEVVVEISYDASDGLDSDTAVVTVTVSGIDDPPVTKSDEATVTVGSSIDIDVLDNDYDPEGDVLVVSALDVTGVIGQIGANLDQTVHYDPMGFFAGLAMDEEAMQSFGYTVADGNGNETSDTAVITIVGVNDAPTADDSDAAADEDTPVAFTPVGDDVDSDDDAGSLTWAVTTAPASGSASVNLDGDVEYDPDGDHEDLAEGEIRKVTLGVTATDSHGAISNEATVTVTITGVNDAPTADDVAGSGDADGLGVATPVGDDVDSDDDAGSLTWAVTTAPASGSASVNLDGDVEYDPEGSLDGLAAGETADVTLGVTATDSHGATSNEATVTITVTGVNDAPEANDDDAATDEDTPILGLDVVSDDDDIDGDILWVDSVDGVSAEGATVAISEGEDEGLRIGGPTSVDYDPTGALDWLAEGMTVDDTFDYDVTDGSLTDTGTVTVTVTGINDAPEADDDEYQISVLGPVTIGNVLDNDTDIDVFDSLSVVSLDLTGTTGSVLSNGDGTFSYTTPVLLTDGATDSFSYTIEDSVGAQSTATVTIAETDADDDGFGLTGDCDDSDPAVNPDATEVPYDGVDNDCVDGDEVDVDDDGWDALAPVGGSPDCNDGDPAINPGAEEIAYDTIDQDCDGSDLTDVDGDAYDAEIAGGTDCDDGDPGVNPGAVEIPYDGIDQDCDGSDLTDVDGDAYDAEIAGGTDCDDGDPGVNPGAVEIPYDGIDQDCDGSDLTDVDGDAYDAEIAGGTDCDDDDAAVNPGELEDPFNGIDDNCDGQIDEGEPT